MFKDVADTVNVMKEKAMEAILPKELPTKMRERFLELSHKMSPKQIAEVGQKFVEAKERAMKEYRKQKEERKLAQV